MNIREKVVRHKDVIITYFLSVFIMMLSLCRKWNFSVIMDYMGTIGTAATLGGCDWSGVMSMASYYGYGYYWIYAILFLITDNPYIIWGTILVANLLVLGTVSIIAYYILNKSFGIKSRWLVISLAAITSLKTVGFGISNEVPLTVIIWIIMLLVLKCYESREDKIKNCKYSILLAISLVFSLMVHERAMIVWIGLFLGLLLFFWLFQEKVILSKLFPVVLCGGFIIHRLIRSVVLSKVWHLGKGEKISNTSAFLTSSLLREDSIGSIKAAVDVILSNLYKLSIMSYGTAIIAIVVVMYCFYTRIRRKKIKHLENIIEITTCKKEVLLILIAGIACAAMIGGLAVKERHSLYATYVTGDNVVKYKILFYWRYYSQLAGIILAAVFSICIKLRGKLWKLLKWALLLLILIFVYLTCFIFDKIINTTFFGINISLSPLYTRFLNNVDTIDCIANIIITLIITGVLLLLFMGKRENSKIILCIIYAMTMWNLIVSEQLKAVPRIENKKLDICYNVIHKANEIEKLPETIYVYTENPHSIFSYQMILNRYCMQYDIPEESVEEAIVFSEQKMEDDKCDIKYYCVQLAESEWLYVKGDRYKTAFENIGLVFEN